jgi:GDP-mannose 4,6-dehydratase
MEQKYCRICKDIKFAEIMDLGIHALAGRFPSSIEEKIPNCKLVLVKCLGKCGLVQLKYNIERNELYNHFYGYMSGINTTMKTHLENLVIEINRKIDLGKGDLVLDIGSNDCTTLKFYNNNLNRIGIDPAGEQFRNLYTDGIKLVSNYFDSEFVDIYINKYITNNVKVVTTIAMFYDLLDPVQFAKNIKKILHPEGIWITEQSYLPSMLKTNSFDTICHEHLEYYSFKQIEYIAEQADLEILDLSFNDINGGSFRITLGHKNINRNFIKNQDLINKTKLNEKNMGLDTLEIYQKFTERCDKLKIDLTTFLRKEKELGKKICIYGASTKGNVLLQYCKIDNTLIDYIAERNPYKYGKFTPQTLIPIVSEEQVRNTKPDYMLVLPWHFKKEFLEREKEYINNGGRLIFPLPIIEILPKKKRCLITGMRGQIGTYLYNLLKNTHDVFGTTRENTCIPYIHCDLINTTSVSKVIDLVVPDEIYNLAGETNNNNSILYPLETFDINIKSIIILCEVIKNKNYPIKLFQPMSSELFKGKKDEEIIVTPQNTTFYPKTPYSISKVTGYWTIRYYREKYNLPFYNGFIFNTESRLRRNGFLTTKISQAILYRKVLEVENIFIRKNWLHAEDVANAIKLCMTGNPDDYIFSSGKTNTIKELIEISYSIVGKNIHWEDTKGYDIETGELLINSTSILNTFNNNENVYGIDDKMEKLGWIPKYTLEDIMKDLLSNNL